MSDYEHRDLELKIADLERKIEDLDYTLRRSIEDLEDRKAPIYHSHEVEV